MLLSVPARCYDQLRGACAVVPSASAQVLACLAYLAAVALQSLGWLGMLRATAPEASTSLTGSLPHGPALRLWQVLLLGSAVQLAAMIAPPFLSADPLFYAAVGRATARYAASPYAQLCQVLPTGDPILQALPERWRCGSSPYGPGWNALADALARLAPASFGLQLRLYQAIAWLALLASAALAGLAARSGAPLDHEPTAQSRSPSQRPDRAPWAAAIVLFSPLSIIEGTNSAHNDAFLALAVAAFAFCAARRRMLFAGLSLAVALFIKLSALLLCGFFLLAQALRLLRGHRAARWIVGLGFSLLVPAALLALLTTWQNISPALRNPLHGLLVLVGDPRKHDPNLAFHCTRSVECLPRAFLYWVLHADMASWVVGLLFRAGAVAWLFYASLRAAREPQARLLRWAAAFFLIYYLYLHGFMQSWYLLPLLPLLPFISARLRPAAFLLCVCAVSYYVFFLPIQCAYTEEMRFWIGSSEFLQAAAVIIPPTILLLLRSRKTLR